MNTSTLPLFTDSSFNTSNNEPKPTLITEEQIITPLVQVLEQTNPNPEQPQQELKKSQTFTEALNNLFPEQQYEEKSIQTAKELLGSIAQEFTPEELKCAVVEIQYLVETWLDDFERDIFNGQTLQELFYMRKENIYETKKCYL